MFSSSDKRYCWRMDIEWNLRENQSKSEVL
jgi:hypothetical protein